MSNVFNQIATLSSMLEQATPYAHEDRQPFNAHYKLSSNHNIEAILAEDSFRSFGVFIKAKRAINSGVQSRLYQVGFEVVVLYPLAQNAAQAENYFCKEVDLLRDIFENSSNYSDGVHLISYEDSTINTVDNNRLLFVHSFSMLADEQL